MARRPTQAPAFDATTATKGMAAAWSRFPAWKRWVEATGDQDVKGLRDVVDTNAVQLTDVKGDVDEHAQRLADLEGRMAAVEARPSAPFPVA